MISTEFGSEEMLIVEKKKGGSDGAEANLGTFFPITCDATRRQNQQFLKLHHKLNNSQSTPHSPPSFLAKSEITMAPPITLKVSSRSTPSVFN